jgi:hypothetical protein
MNANPQSVQASLSGQHEQLEHQLEKVLAAGHAGQWPQYRAFFGALRDGLLVHMAFEDDAVYPLLEESRLEGLREQHAQLRRYLEMLGAAAPEQDPEGCLAVLDELAELLRQHHVDEMALDPQYAARPVPPLPMAAPAALDLRGLQPPEPIVRIFRELERGASPLRVILPHEPLPLYGLLAERGYSYAGAPRAEGGYEVVIERT